MAVAYALVVTVFVLRTVDLPELRRIFTATALQSGIILLLVGGALANFAALALIGPFFDGLQDMFPAEMLASPEGQRFAAQMQFNRTVTLVTSLAGALVFAALHGWIVWKLCTPAVRDQFRSAPC